MKRIKIPVILGDGIGPEVIHSAMKVCKKVLFTVGVNPEWIHLEIGHKAIEKGLDPLPPAVLDTIRDCGFALKGPTSTPSGTGHRSVNVALRKELELFVNVRPMRYFPNTPTRIKNPETIDIVLLRENLEDLYSGIEFTGSEADDFGEFLSIKGFDTLLDSVFSVKPISKTRTKRLAEYALEYMELHGGRKNVITCITKSNIMKVTDGLFEDTCEDVIGKSKYEFRKMLVDNACAQLIRNNQQFDLIITENLYGDILSDLIAELVGGLGYAPGANIGEQYSVFEPVHGTAENIAGQNKANPIAAILSAAMMLEHMGYHKLKMLVDNSVYKTSQMYSLHKMSTSKITEKIIENL